MNKHITHVLAATAVTLLIGCQVVSGDRTINQYSSDAALTTSVKTALLDNSKVTSLPIHVETDKGMVVLSGFVKNIEQKNAAGIAASKVKNVRGVQNNLIVRR